MRCDTQHPVSRGWLALLTIVLLISAGCPSPNGTPNTGAVPSATEPGVQAEAAHHQPASNKRNSAQGQMHEGTDSAENSWVIGLDADVSSGAARSGEAIRRGIELALEKINAQGGILDRPVLLEVRDHRGNPDRGIDNLAELSKLPNLLAVVGGIHTPVALQQLPIIHEKRLLYLSSWAAGTSIVDNGYDPNFVFRVSIRDEHAGGFMVAKAVERDLKHVGLLLERTGWGRSNEVAMLDALRRFELEPAGVEWFNWGEKSMSRQLNRLHEQGADVVLLVCNPLEGTEIVRTMARTPEARRMPIISHWGITAGTFFEDCADELQQVDLSFIQSYSFLQREVRPASLELMQNYIARFEDATGPRDIFCPVGTAHAYELVMLLAQAVEDAGTSDADAIRHCLETMASFDGVIKHYQPPFRPDHHDALNGEDYILARFAADGVIVPVDD